MKKIILFYLFVVTAFAVNAQDSTSNRRSSKEERKEAKRQRINAMIKQEEEGVLSYHKQFVAGLQLRTNGYGGFLELGRMKSPRFTTTYSFEFTEIKHPKEEKTSRADVPFSNQFVFGKVNNFYQAKLGFGQQYIFGQKGNKNGVAVIGTYQGGLALGLLKPYYIEIADNGVSREINYFSEDSTKFLDPSVIIGGAGFWKGWGELKVQPGAYIKTALRFDFGRYNESVQAVEIGLSVDAYAKKIQIMAEQNGGTPYVKAERLFFQGHIAFVFGRRK